jgi:hypothetical protein
LCCIKPSCKLEKTTEKATFEADDAVVVVKGKAVPLDAMEALHDLGTRWE